MCNHDFLNSMQKYNPDVTPSMGKYCDGDFVKYDDVVSLVSDLVSKQNEIHRRCQQAERNAEDAICSCIVNDIALEPESYVWFIEKYVNLREREIDRLRLARCGVHRINVSLPWGDSIFVEEDSELDRTIYWIEKAIYQFSKYYPIISRDMRTKRCVYSKCDEKVSHIEDMRKDGIDTVMGFCDKHWKLWQDFSDCNSKKDSEE